MHYTMTMDDALRLVPEHTPNRERLAALLREINAAPVSKQLEALRRHASHLAEYHRARALLEVCPHDTAAYRIVYAAARRRWETARRYARVHGLAPVRWGRSPR